MNHVYSIHIFNIRKDYGTKAYLLTQAYDITNLPFIARVTGSGIELLKFTARTLVERTCPGSPTACNEDNFMCWTYVRNDGLGGVVITDDKYPQRIAFDLIHKCMIKYETKDTSWDWSTIENDRVNNEVCNDMLELIQKYKEPTKADSLENCRNEIDKTKIKLYKSIDLILERGEKIDTLADKSADLSNKSKNFAKKAKKLNSWCPNGCTIM